MVQGARLSDSHLTEFLPPRGLTIVSRPAVVANTHGNLARAEEVAVERGCTHARLDTFDFQARDFYERLGYTVYAELPGFPTGHAQLHLRKVLAPVI